MTFRWHPAGKPRNFYQSSVAVSDYILDIDIINTISVAAVPCCIWLFQATSFQKGTGGPRGWLTDAREKVSGCDPAYMEDGPDSL